MKKHKPKNNKNQYSNLGSHKQHGKKLTAPFNQLPNLGLNSWVNDVMPDVLWTVLITNSIDRLRALDIFRLILSQLRDKNIFTKNIILCHSHMSTFTFEEFKHVFAAVASDTQFLKAVRPLLVYKTLPDRAHWEELLRTDQVSWSEVGEDIAHAVAKCFDHQSQNSTDCRWVRAMAPLALDFVRVADQALSEMMQEIVNYPNQGDQRKVRPSIRAFEMASRDPEQYEGMPRPWNEEFWEESYKATSCIPPKPETRDVTNRNEIFSKDLISVIIALSNHFMDTIRTTGIDPQHDGAFGLSLYSLHIALHAANARVDQTVAARSMLRTVMEVYVVLSYLVYKNNPTLWMQYRVYGIGQTKLAFLKNIDSTELPSFVSIDLLEFVANEDIWAELVDIDIGSWSSLNLRQMAIEADVKEIYDKYYDTLSSYVHGNWFAVLHTNFCSCLNPLHRFHRIPKQPGYLSEAAIPDFIRLCNLILERLNSLYPTFKPRLRKQEASTSQDCPEDASKSSGG